MTNFDNIAITDALIFTFENGAWNRESLAKDKNFDPVSPFSDEACSFCLIGGIANVCFIDDYESSENVYGLIRQNEYAIKLAEFIRKVKGYYKAERVSSVLFTFNDQVDYVSEVIEMLKKFRETLLKENNEV